MRTPALSKDVWPITGDTGSEVVLVVTLFRHYVVISTLFPSIAYAAMFRQWLGSGGGGDEHFFRLT